MLASSPLSSIFVTHFKRLFCLWSTPSSSNCALWFRLVEPWPSVPCSWTSSAWTPVWPWPPTPNRSVPSWGSCLLEFEYSAMLTLQIAINGENISKLCLVVCKCGVSGWVWLRQQTLHARREGGPIHCNLHAFRVCLPSLALGKLVALRSMTSSFSSS